MITYHSENISFPKIKRRETTNWIKSIAGEYNKIIGEVNFIFCSDEKILEINRQYLQHDYYTDIITFDYSEPEVFRPQGEKINKISGDIFISLDTVKSNAEQYNQQFETELCRVIIHGILHLCGQKDKNETDRAEMTRKENAALSTLADM